MGSIGVDADMPRDDPTPIFFDLTMVGVVSIHLLAAEAYWTGLLPFFFVLVVLVVLVILARV